jgi:hypothetical protein
VQINAPIENLLGNVLELKNDIYQIQDFLDPAGETAPLPLGAMGRIMAQQLYAETNVLAYHAEQLKSKKTSEWEMARHSSVLKNKVALLSTFASIISQLSAADGKIQKTMGGLSGRVITRCGKLEEMIEGITAAALVVSNRKLVTA